MSVKLLDIDIILSGNDQWMKLEEAWGNPVDLETDEDQHSYHPSFNTLDSKKSTFDSSFLFKKSKRKVGRQLSKTSNPDYSEFLQNLRREESPKNSSIKQFYFINGQIISACSVEEICDNIDDIFKSVEKLSSATSTMRNRKKLKPKVPEIVQCSISGNDLSFDDTEESVKEKDDLDNVDRYIDEVFEQLDSTLRSLSKYDYKSCEEAKQTVTALVKKFSSILKSPVVNKSPRRRRQCSDKFRELTEFWSKRILEECTDQ